VSAPPQTEPALLVANVSLNPRPLSVLLGAENRPEGVADADGRPLPTQVTEGNELLVHAPELSVPGLGWSTLTAIHESAPAPRETQYVGAEVAGGGAIMDNGLLRVEVGDDGTLHGVYDREAGREVLDGRANQLWAYTDKPRNWEAWDVDEGYEQEGEEIFPVESIEVVENGPLRTSVRVVRRWRGSTITQTYRLLSGSRRLDVESYVDWRERRVLLRTLFPLAVRSHETTSETMFGALRRPTHHNTPWDATRF
jgi:alpha-mannosidase